MKKLDHIKQWWYSDYYGHMESLILLGFISIGIICGFIAGVMYHG